MSSERIHDKTSEKNKKKLLIFIVFYRWKPTSRNMARRLRRLHGHLIRILHGFQNQQQNPGPSRDLIPQFVLQMCYHHDALGQHRDHLLSDLTALVSSSNRIQKRRRVPTRD